MKVTEEIDTQKFAPICIPKTGEKLSLSEKAAVASWGLIPDNTAPGKLMVGIV